MNEKLYAKRQVIKIDGREVEIPVVHPNPMYQGIYVEFRQAGKTHAEAEYEAEDASQTKYYETFTVVVRHDGKFIKIPIYSDDEEVQTRYMQLRQMGETHNGADLVITRKTAVIGLCDTVLLKSDLIVSQFSHKDSQARGDALAEKARAMGISTTGKFYHPGIAVEFGDPRAWVGSISDIKEVCKDRNWSFDIKDNEMKIGVRCDLAQTLQAQFAHKPAKVGA